MTHPTPTRRAMTCRHRSMQQHAVIAIGCLLLASCSCHADELNSQIDLAIDRSLPWLADQQQPSGAWEVTESGASTGVTSLAILAFLAAGHVPEEGPWGENLTRGIAWTLQQQEPNGMLLGPASSHGPMYSHGITTLMLAEVSGMVHPSQTDDVRGALERAVKLIIAAQNQPRAPAADGGWRYLWTSSDSDLSVSAWQLLALRAARDIGCDVPTENIDRAIAYIKRLSVTKGGGFGYTSSTSSTATRAGTGIVALEVCGEHRSVETLAAAKFILSHPLTIHEPYFYYGAYYCTVGMYKIGGDEWRAARPALYSTILDLQTEDDCWVPREQSSEHQSGAVYATAMSLLALTIENGYLPIYQR